MLKYMIPALALIFVGACGDDKGDETGDTGTTTGDDDDDDDTVTPTEPPASPSIDYIEPPGCVGGEIVYYAETLGWTNGENIVNIWEQGDQGWNEQHDLPSVSFDPDGYWDILEQTLVAGSSVADFEENVNSVFTCAADDTVDHSNVYAIRVYDVNGNYSDCAIFEDDAPGGIDEVYDGTINNLAGNPPAEINSTDCVEWTLN